MEVVYVVKVVIIVGIQSILRSGLAKQLIDMMLLPQSQTRLGSSGVALNLDSDKLRSFNYREKLNSTV